MKRISILLLIFLLVFSCVCFADDAEVVSGPDEFENISDNPEVVYPYSNITPLLQDIADTLKETNSNGSIEIEPQESTTLQQLRLSANDTTGLHAVLLSLIGDYNPIVKDYTYTSNNGYVNHSIEITPDWSWIMTAGLFIVVIFSVFRIFGGIVKGL